MKPGKGPHHIPDNAGSPMLHTAAAAPVTAADAAAVNLSKTFFCSAVSASFLNSNSFLMFMCGSSPPGFWYFSHLLSKISFSFLKSSLRIDSKQNIDKTL